MKRSERVTCDECKKQINGEAFLEIAAQYEDDSHGVAVIRDNCVLDFHSRVHFCSRACTVAGLMLDDASPEGREAELARLKADESVASARAAEALRRERNARNRRKRFQRAIGRGR